MIDLAAVAPDPGNPTFVPIASAIFFTLVWSVGAALRWSRDLRQRRAEDGAAIGAAVALAVYLFGLATGLY